MQLSRLRPLNLSSFIFITNTKEFASFCLCVLYSGRSTVHAETPSSRICDKRFFHCGPYKQGAGWSVAIGKSIEWLCMEDCHSVKLSRLLALTALVLNGSLPNSCLLLGEPICIVFLQRSLRLVVGRHTQLP